MRRVQAFRSTNHDELAEMINVWLEENNALLISISVDKGQGLGSFFHAFVIYEIQ